VTFILRGGIRTKEEKVVEEEEGDDGADCQAGVRVFVPNINC
jgi:hypothetical protein